MSKPYINRVFSTIIFYVGWIVSLKEVDLEHSYFGFFLVLSFIAYFLYRSNCRKADYLLLALVLFIGPLSDIFYSQLGLLKYHSVKSLSSWLPPLWVYVLWGLFGTNIHLFSWLSHRWWLAILLGAIGGPASYLSVIRLGGASMLKPLPMTLLAIGGIWAIFLPMMIWCDKYLKKRFKAIP